jgi:hypothetical protein
MTLALTSTGMICRIVMFLFMAITHMHVCMMHLQVNVKLAANTPQSAEDKKELVHAHACVMYILHFLLFMYCTCLYF